MQVSGKVLTNYNNVFLLIKTDTVFNFANESEMKSFMKYDFPDDRTIPGSAYCVQQPGNPQLFQCLMIYGSGVPNFDFYINFSYNKDGKSGYLGLHVDPLASGFASRSLT